MQGGIFAVNTKWKDMIKELFILARMLFHRTSLSGTLEMVEMKHFPFSGYSYMMWCGYIVTRKKEKRISETSLRHEGIHVQQAMRYSHWYKFYLKYIWEWIKGNPVIHPARSAYYTIPFEVEAYANQDVKGYVATVDTLKRYKLNGRKKVYRKYRACWLEYIKLL